MASHLSHLWVYGIRYGLYFAFAWAAVYWRRWQKRRRESIAQGWPSVEARIISGQVAPLPKTSCFLATLQYTYFVEEYRTGTYVHEFPKEIDADEFVRQLKDKRVQVRYNQAKPDKSVLEQSVVAQHFVLTPRFG
jgi:hypothetical protein